MIGGVAIFYWWSNFGPSTAFAIELIAEVLIVALFTAVMIRGGILPALVALFVVNVCQTVALTLDVTHWSATTSNLTLALVAAMTAYGFVAARTGEPLFGRLPAEICRGRCVAAQILSGSPATPAASRCRVV